MIRYVQPQVNAYECSFISDDPKTTVYWDGGISKVNEFLQEHDTACNTMGMQSLKVEDSCRSKEDS